ncbi:hypothetical protein D8B26_001533 [Coccidioides posadasii str. Silveira]|uniref:Uncharacterized protein n=3 Tax=Coccidioides posadasii TaxID=199306 RepID=E9CVJ5_COCPS|nr:GTPase family protein [Coccidioides posadasii C735 delta SOWgp]EER23427.1 GTPase family protein [Coccidioides posadasii C735 delta SOWgp]EFW21321.1 conserved hypothetical protein [Coccidioides posadasii str. Silveira]KMM64790.1 GTP-binding protein [Coccidioides posadasii RMSCC 3488]QVM06829.1 hypothetical protein D8B26_001533 [Coccidioides posadasii str. Silveira]|eukprot:XP_003065572.1 GTPase family protein [Coccidioides posadasii C735 delta SOWgp]
MGSPIFRRYLNRHFIRTLKRSYSTAAHPDNIPTPGGLPPLIRGTQDAPSSGALTNKPSLEDYCFYRDTLPPKPSQLEYADHFFAASKHSPVYLWGSSLFRTIPVSSIPEIAFIGRSNVGKSSIINGLVGEDICASSSKPGRTKLMASIGVGGTKGGGSKIALVDTPGYGKGSHTEWGQEIQKYLEKRKQLRRIFLLIDAGVGLKTRDHQVLNFLRRFAIPYQLVLTKLDHALSFNGHKNKTKPNDSRSDLIRFSQTVQDILSSAQPVNPILDGPGPLNDVIACSVQMQSKKQKKSVAGLRSLRWAILLATGFDQIPKGFKFKR